MGTHPDSKRQRLCDELATVLDLSRGDVALGQIAENQSTQLGTFLGARLGDFMWMFSRCSLGHFQDSPFDSFCSLGNVADPLSRKRPGSRSAIPQLQPA
jgi:hypothetical protein